MLLTWLKKSNRKQAEAEFKQRLKSLEGSTVNMALYNYRSEIPDTLRKRARVAVMGLKLADISEVVNRLYDALDAQDIELYEFRKERANGSSISYLENIVREKTRIIDNLKLQITSQAESIRNYQTRTQTKATDQETPAPKQMTYAEYIKSPKTEAQRIELHQQVMGRLAKEATNSTSAKELLDILDRIR